MKGGAVVNPKEIGAFLKRLRNEKGIHTGTVGRNIGGFGKNRFKMGNGK